MSEGSVAVGEVGGESEKMSERLLVVGEDREGGVEEGVEEWVKEGVEGIILSL